MTKELLAFPQRAASVRYQAFYALQKEGYIGFDSSFRIDVVSGIGAATVRRIIKEGARVIIADIEDKQGQALAAELGQHATFVHCDVR